MNLQSNPSTWTPRTAPGTRRLAQRVTPARPRPPARSWAGPIALWLLGATLASPHAQVYLSPSEVLAAPGADRLYVTAATHQRVLVVDPAQATVVSHLALPAAPNGMALSRDGARLYVACGEAGGSVVVFETATGTAQRNMTVGHTPVAPVLSPNGERLLVCDRFANAVLVLDLGSGKESARIGVPREPIAAQLSPDGRYLFVANHLPAMAANQFPVAAVVRVLDLQESRLAGTIELPNGSSSLRGMGSSADGKHLYVTHLLSRYQMPTTQLERGWMNTAALTVIDVASRQRLNTFLLDDVDLGAANPWGVVASTDGRWLLVTHAGTHELSVIDQPALLEKLARVARGEKVSEVSATAEDVPNDLSFLVGLRRRVALPGNGPRGLALTQSGVAIAEYFSDSLALVQLDGANRPRVKSLALGPTQPLTVVRRGEQVFNDASICFQSWQSCASCHPDARVDGFNWDLLNDGIGTPKNTKNMLMAHATPPAMSLGVRETTETAVRSGIRHILFAVRPEEEAVAMDEYLKSLRPVPSPRRVQGELSEAAQRGASVFVRADCQQCHPAPLFTDLKTYDVGTGTGRERHALFDTPTLIEVWRTGPYLHDGRAASIHDVLRRYNSSGRHGRTADLTEQELNDLAEYVLSL